MKKLTFQNILIVLLAMFLFHCSYGQQEIFGQVSDGTLPIENVSVSVKDTERTVLTDASGKYRINAAEGETIVYSANGKKPLEILVEDVTSILNVVLYSGATELDEVVVTEERIDNKRKMELKWMKNDDVIKTAYGYLDRMKSAHPITIINNRDFNKGAIDFAGAIQGKFPGQFSRNKYQEPIFRIRGTAHATVLYDVDGVVMQRPPLEIPLEDIDRIAVIRSLNALAKYPKPTPLTPTIGGLRYTASPEPISAVIVINTKSANYTQDPTTDMPYDYARLRGNFLTETVLSRNQVKENWPAYKKELYSAKNPENAKDIYETHLTGYSSSPYFLLDAYKYFNTVWKEYEYADSIIQNNYRVFEDNALLLKALAYHYQELGFYQKAEKVFKDIFILRPHYAQSYMDIATSYRDLEKHKKATSIYVRYDYLLEEGFMRPDTLDFLPLLEREYSNLLALEKKSLVDNQKAKSLYVGEKEFKGTRFVFEWNDSEAEFELQFVNPQNQYYIWKHTLKDNPELIKREKKYGFSSAEQFIDSSSPGTWMVNATFRGNKSLTPIYLKATIYQNYGEQEQSKVVKLFKLSLKNVSQELFSVTNNVSPSLGNKL